MIEPSLPSSRPFLGQVEGVDTVMKYVVGSLIFGAAFWITLWNSVVLVEPSETAIITQFGKVVGKHQPGIKLKIPYVQSAWFIDVSLQFVQNVETTVILANDESCSVRARVLFNIVDPIRAYEWRRDNKLGDSRTDRAPYKQPAVIFRQTLLEAMKSMTLEEARAGGIERWIEKFKNYKYNFRSTVDGTGSYDASAHKVDCT